MRHLNRQDGSIRRQRFGNRVPPQAGIHNLSGFLARLGLIEPLVLRGHRQQAVELEDS